MSSTICFYAAKCKISTFCIIIECFKTWIIAFIVFKDIIAILNALIYLIQWALSLAFLNNYLMDFIIIDSMYILLFHLHNLTQLCWGWLPIDAPVQVCYIEWLPFWSSTTHLGRTSWFHSTHNNYRRFWITRIRWYPVVSHQGHRTHWWFFHSFRPWAARLHNFRFSTFQCHFIHFSNGKFVKNPIVTPKTLFAYNLESWLYFCTWPLFLQYL